MNRMLRTLAIALALGPVASTAREAISWHTYTCV